MKPQEAKTELEKRVLTLMKDSGYMLPEGYEPPGSLYALCRNVVKCCGPEPTDEEIEHEILLFYNT